MEAEEEGEKYVQKEGEIQRGSASAKWEPCCLPVADL